jgi:hypothetical protein
MDNDALFARVIDKLDKLDEKLGSMDNTLIRQEEQLAYHIKRTDLLEQKLEPVETHVKRVDGAGKLLGILAIIVGIVGTLYAIVK